MNSLVPQNVGTLFSSRVTGGGFSGSDQLLGVGCVVLLGSSPAMGRSPVQGVLVPTFSKVSYLQINSEWERARRSHTQEEECSDMRRRK
jgi:hypothetical protein